MSTSSNKSYLKDKQENQTNYQSINPSKTFRMNYDDILLEIGELGPWQIGHLLALWLPAIASGIFVLTYSFSGNISTQVKITKESFLIFHSRTWTVQWVPLRLETMW